MLSALSAPECAVLLGTGSVGRVVYTENALPVVVLVPYVMDGQTVIFRTTGRSALARATSSAVVAFQVDDVDPVTGTGWSVVVTGLARRLPADGNGEGPGRSAGAEQAVQITPGLLSGSRIGPGRLGPTVAPVGTAERPPS